MLLYRLSKREQLPIVGTSQSHVWVCALSKKNHLARCLVSGVTDGRHNSRRLFLVRKVAIARLHVWMCMDAFDVFLRYQEAAIVIPCAPGYASAFAGSSRPGVPEAALGHGRSW